MPVREIQLKLIRYMAVIVSMITGVAKTMSNCISDYEMNCIILKVYESVGNISVIFLLQLLT